MSKVPLNACRDEGRDLPGYGFRALFYAPFFYEIPTGLQVESGTFSKGSTRSSNNNIFDAVIAYLQGGMQECKILFKTWPIAEFSIFLLFLFLGYRHFFQVIVVGAGSGHLPLYYAALGSGCWLTTHNARRSSSPLTCLHSCCIYVLLACH